MQFLATTDQSFLGRKNNTKTKKYIEVDGNNLSLDNYLGTLIAVLLKLSCFW